MLSKIDIRFSPLKPIEFSGKYLDYLDCVLLSTEGSFGSIIRDKNVVLLPQVTEFVGPFLVVDGYFKAYV